MFDNELGEFVKELHFIDLLMRHFGEAVSGDAGPVRLEQLSSSVPAVALAASAQVIDAIAKVINAFLDAWEKIERIRRIRSELTEVGLKGAAVN